MKNLALIIFIFLAAFACSSKKEYETPELLINANAEYMNEEDLEGVMTTVHPQSPNYAATEAMAKQIFDRYDLNYKIENIKCLRKMIKKQKLNSLK